LVSFDPDPYIYIFWITKNNVALILGYGFCAVTIQ
jgi:hypothetical protein